MKSIIYLHGLASSGQSATATSLRKLLPEWEIISPDIPINPKEALHTLRKLCKEVKPKFVIGTSMGGMFAQQMHGYSKILVNPAFHVSEFMRKNIGKHIFFSPRKDGMTHFEITPELCDIYAEIESHQFDDILPIDKGITMGFFGTKDELVDCRDEYFKYYSYGMMFEGEHRLSEEIVKNVIIKWINIYQSWIRTAKLSHIQHSTPEHYEQKYIEKIYSDKNKYGLIGENNCIYDELFVIPYTTLYACRKGMKWGVLKYDNEENLKTIVPCELDMIFECAEDQTGLVPLIKDFKWGFADSWKCNGYIPNVYDDIDWGCEEPILVLKDGKWGYLNHEGEFTTNINEAGYISYLID